MVLLQQFDKRAGYLETIPSSRSRTKNVSTTLVR